LYSFGSGGNAEENAHSSSSLLLAVAAGAAGVVEVGAGDVTPIKLAKGSAAGWGGLKAGCAGGWGVAEVDAEGEMKDENGEGGAPALLFCVTDESNAGPGMPIQS